MTGNALNHGKCLTEDTLTDYLEGGLELALKTASEVHLVECDDCRVRLAFFMRLLKEEIVPEEAEMVRAIQEEWTRAQNDRRLPSRRTSDRRNWLIASGGMAAALLIAVGTRLSMEYKGEPNSANEVIQLLLEKDRPFEARISSQPHLPFIATRGPTDPAVAYSLLAGQMSRLSATTYEMGQFCLLQRDFVNAIKYLELAERESGASADVHNDLGVAYMESKIDENRQRAIAEFRHALGKKPDHLPAAFNLALAYEQWSKNDQAQKQWTEYMQLEFDRAWKDEAKARLEGIKP